MKGFLIFSVVLIAVLITGTFFYFSIRNKHELTRTEYFKQIDQDKIVHDQMWKILQSQAGVSGKYAEDFTKAYTNIMKSRNYGGEMMKWIQEQNPTFDIKLYDKLMTSIEVQRTQFTTVQSKLIAIHGELRNQLTLFPSSFFLGTIGGYILPELKIVTSGKTEEDFETGQDNDVDLFEKEKADTTKN